MNMKVCYLSGHDKDGCSALLIFPRNYKPNKINQDEYMRYVIYYVEKAIEKSRLNG